MKKLALALILLLILETQPIMSTRNTPHNYSYERLIILLKPTTNFLEKISKHYYSSEMELKSYRLMVYGIAKRAYEDSFKKLSEVLDSINGKLLGKMYSLGIAVVRVPKEYKEVLEKTPFVVGISPDIKFRVLMDVAARAVKANYLWDAGLNGSESIGDSIKGVEVAVVDTGVYHSKYLEGRIIDEKSFVSGEDENDYNGHGTRVASIIASDHPTYRGIAYGANIINAKAMDQAGEGYMSDIIEAIEWAFLNASDPAEIINLSLGAPEDPNEGLYADGTSLITKIIDAFSYLYDVVFVVAVGNVEGGYSGVNIPADTFNGIAVGAINDENTYDREDDTIYSGSCRGPTRDGRLKPEVVAPGVSITTITKGDNIGTGSGTSFATPIVAGGAAIFYAYLLRSVGIDRNLGLAVKALIINSADVWGSIDNTYGFGYVNYENALNQAKYVKIINITTNNRFVFTVNLSAGENYSFTATWYRVPRSITDISNIDFYDIGAFRIIVKDPANTIIYRREERLNNTLKVAFTANTSGIYTISIEKLYREKAPISEIVALASTKELKPVNVTLSAKGGIIYDNSGFLLRVRINNRDEPLDNAKLKVIVNGRNEKILELGDINSGESREVEVSLEDLIRSIGDYNISIVLISNDNVVVENGTYMRIIDDDSEPPSIDSFYVHCESTDNKLVIRLNVTDESGIKFVRFYWRLDNPLDNNTLDLADGYINLSYRNGVYEGIIEYPDSWDGKTLNYVLVVADNDSDRPNDSAVRFVMDHIKISALKGKIIVAIVLVVIIVVIIIIRLYIERKKARVSIESTRRKRGKKYGRRV